MPGLPEVDITGRRYGRLVALRREGYSRAWRALWLCRCDCGRLAIVHKNNLVRGRVRSCGCLRSELSRERMIRMHGNKAAMDAAGEAG